jgi:2'-5' RNA ligase
MRLFTGIDIPPEVKESLEALLGRLRPRAAIGWSPVANLHITTKFIGEWPESRLGEIVDTLRGLPQSGPIPIEIRGIGWFPNPHSPRVFWVGVHASEALARLAAGTDTALAELGVAKEDRKFSPHLTLARIKGPADLAALRQEVARLPGVEFGSFAADRFHLYHSKPSAAGSTYVKLADFLLAAA